MLYNKDMEDKLRGEERRFEAAEKIHLFQHRVRA